MLGGLTRVYGRVLQLWLLKKEARLLYERDYQECSRAVPNQLAGLRLGIGAPGAICGRGRCKVPVTSDLDPVPEVIDFCQLFCQTAFSSDVDIRVSSLQQRPT